MSESFSEGVFTNQNTKVFFLLDFFEIESEREGRDFKIDFMDESKWPMERNDVENRVCYRVSTARR